MNLRPTISAELQSIENTRAAYRAMWSRLRNVPRRDFDGGRADIDALDFIDYEGGSHPEGLVGAATIWGGVLVETGGLSWAILDEQHLVLVSVGDYPRAILWPYARVAEINATSIPQFGKYEWLLEEAVARLSGLGFDDEVEQRLQSLLRPETDGFLDYTKRQIDSLQSLPRQPDR